MKNKECFDFKAFEQALQSLGKGLAWDGEDEWKLNVVVHRFILAYHQVAGALFAYVPQAFPVNGMTIRGCVEAAVVGGWLKTPVLWAEMHENRNLAAHPYSWRRIRGYLSACRLVL